jgi:DNA-directed RNA polymerase subunit RPC12/RpoP
LLVVVDGTEYFSSAKIACEQCSHRALANGQVRYFHSVLTPVTVDPGNPNVLALEPEFIVPQDGELRAFGPWLARAGHFYVR